MLVKPHAGVGKLNFIKKIYKKLFVLLCVAYIYESHSLYGNDSVFKNHEASRDKKINASLFNQQTFTYYLYITEFTESFIEIPTSNVTDPSSTTSSNYLAGRSPLYNVNNEMAGTCSASFLCMQNAYGIYTDIANFLSVDSGLIVTWFTPTKLINLELDSIINSMVTECMVTASTNVGVNPFYGQTFNLIVSSDNEKIYFQFTRTGMIF